MLETKLDTRELDGLIKKLEQAPEVFQQARREAMEQAAPKLLQAVRDGMYQRALENRERRTFVARTLDEMVQVSNEHSGFIKAMWCGDAACEEKLKEVAGVSSRCMPFDQEQLSDTCVCCGKPAKSMVIWGKAY